MGQSSLSVYCNLGLVLVCFGVKLVKCIQCSLVGRYELQFDLSVSLLSVVKIALHWLAPGQRLLLANLSLMGYLLYSLYWSIHTKDESKRDSAFAFIFGVN